MADSHVKVGIWRKLRVDLLGVMSEKIAELCGLLMPLLQTVADGTFALLS